MQELFKLFLTENYYIILDCMLLKLFLSPFMNVCARRKSLTFLFFFFQQS